jgi:hypothetical protein
VNLIRNQKDFWAGAIYMAVAAAAIIIARDYTFGTGARMGPGYFPTVLASLLFLLGLASMVRSFVTPGEPIGEIAWKPMILVILATLLFAVLIAPLGLIVALLVLVLVSAAASVKFAFDWRAVAGLVVLVAFCSLVFVKGLGVPMPLVGSVLEPYAPIWLR